MTSPASWSTTSSCRRSGSKYFSNGRTAAASSATSRSRWPIFSITPSRADSNEPARNRPTQKGRISMVMARKEDHLRMRMEHVRFGKEELERRRKSPVHVKAEEIDAQLKEHNHVYIVDPRLGFNQRTFRFWINLRTPGEEMEFSGW